MSNPLLEITVRPDWQEIDRRWAARSAELWRSTQVAVLAAVLASMLLGTLAPNWPGLVFVLFVVTSELTPGSRFAFTLPALDAVRAAGQTRGDA